MRKTSVEPIQKLVGTAATWGIRPRVLATDVPRPFSISPDGRRVAFTRESRYAGLSATPGLYVVDAASSQEAMLASVDRAGFGGSGPFWRPLWSPDSATILLPGSHHPPGEEAIPDDGLTWAASDGSSPHILSGSELDAALAVAMTAKPGEVCRANTPLVIGNRWLDAVGPCSAALGEPGPVPSTHIAIYEVDVATGAVAVSHLLPVEEESQVLAWETPGESLLLNTPDGIQSLSLTSINEAPASPPVAVAGTAVAYVQEGDLYIRDSQQEGAPILVEKCADNACLIHFSVWSPDGRFLLYYWNAGDYSGQSLRVADRSGQVVSTLNDVAYFKPATWSLDGHQIAFLRETGQYSGVTLNRAAGHSLLWR